MPPRRNAPRRSTSGSTAAQQATLTFNGRSNRVTKPSATPAPGKKAAKQDPAIVESITSPHFDATAPIDVADPEVDEEPTTAEAAIEEQALEVKEPSDPNEETARKVTDAKIKSYWRSKESERKAPRVHQESLSLHEKILREFDLNSKFGPCIGIPRTKRWKRARALGLEPPFEVLAVLLKETDGKKETGRVERAYVDELMASRFVEGEKVVG